MEARATTLRRLQQLLRSGRVVNVVGPLGIGKTTLLGELGETVEAEDLLAVAGAGCRAVVLAGGASPAIVIDGAESAPAARELLVAVGSVRAGAPVVVASRLPLLSRAGWARNVRGLITLTLARWSDDAIEQLAAGYPTSDAATVELAVTLSGGIPLIADCLCRTVAGGTPATMAGAVVGPAVDEILRRLEREHLTGEDAGALMTLAAVGEADEELLISLGASAFPALSRLSITMRSVHGLTVKEPYRVLLDLAHRWRRPLAHQALLTKAAASRRRLLAATTTGDPAAAGIATQLMFLTGNRTVRDALFPSSAQSLTVRAAQPGDEEDIARLLHRWARRGGLSEAKCELMLEAWLGSTPNGFQLAIGGDGRPVAMVNMLPAGDQTQDVTQMLLQQHAETLAGGMRPGQLIGLAISDEGQSAAHAALIRDLLFRSFQHGRVLVSTPWPAYQHLARGLGFVHHGATRDDLYRCGRQNEIYGQDFAPEHVPAWLDRLCVAGRYTAADPHEQRIAAQVRQALRDIHHPARLSANPLRAWLDLSTAEDLRTPLLLAIQGLCSSDTPADAEAGHVLADYYLSRRGGHEHVANKLHLSRSTYFRRLNHGIVLLASRLPRPGLIL
jgi:hypothetical protein